MKNDDIVHHIEKIDKKLKKLAHLPEQEKAKIVSYMMAALCSKPGGRFSNHEAVMLYLQVGAVQQGYIVKEMKDNPNSKGDAADYVMLMSGMSALAKLMDVKMPESVRKLMGHKAQESEELVDAALEAERLLQRAQGRDTAE